MGASPRRRKRPLPPGYWAFARALRRIPSCADPDRMESLPWETQQVVRQTSWFRFRSFGAGFLRAVGLMVVAPKFGLRLHAIGWRSEAGPSRPNLAVIPLRPSFNFLDSSSAFQAVYALGGFRERGRGRFRLWVSLSAGLLAGAGLTLGLALAQRDRTEPATPSDRRAAPRSTPDQERPYVQPIHIGMGPDNPIAGASALPRGSTAFWRDGEASLTEAAFSLVVTGRRV